MAKNNNDLAITMAQALAGGTVQPQKKPDPVAKKELPQPKPAPAAVKPRRRSIIEKDLLPEPKKKRTRKKKDPALKKSHSFTLLLTEQLYERFKATAEEQGFSMNGIATRLIKKYVALHDVDGDDLGI